MCRCKGNVVEELAQAKRDGHPGRRRAQKRSWNGQKVGMLKTEHQINQERDLEEAHAGATKSAKVDLWVTIGGGG